MALTIVILFMVFSAVSYTKKLLAALRTGKKKWPTILFCLGSSAFYCWVSMMLIVQPEIVEQQRTGQGTMGPGISMMILMVVWTLIPLGSFALAWFLNKRGADMKFNP